MRSDPDCRPNRYGLAGLGNGGLPRLHAQLKQSPDDFEVDELPAYEPCGEGEHLYLKIEKRGLSSSAMKESLKELLSLSDAEIGMAGLKDQAAVTRQWVSVPARCELALQRLEASGLKILESSRHKNKLRVGHLRGNRFTIRLPTLKERDHLEQARAIATVIAANGVPNFYGPQRFGDKGDTSDIGRAIFEGRKGDVPQRWRAHTAKIFALSALQSEVFNEILMSRLKRWPAETLLTGDVMMKGNGALFVVHDLAAETARFAARETQPTGLMFGNDVFKPEEDALAFEEAELQKCGITHQRMSGWGKTLAGARRQLFIYPQDLTITHSELGLRFAFSLPPGAYATVVMGAFITDPEPEVTPS